MNRSLLWKPITAAACDLAAARIEEDRARRAEQLGSA